MYITKNMDQAHVFIMTRANKVYHTEDIQAKSDIPG